jgi:starch-binding outer membrane protein, SusD/RagB family
MTMNKILKKGFFYLLVCLSIGVFISCKDSLEEVVYSELTTDNAFSTKSDAQAAINALYSPLISLTRTPIFYLNDMSTDACFKEGWDYELLNESNLPGSEAVNTSWNGYYTIIGRANVAIDNISKMDNLSFGSNDVEGQTAKDELIAEAYFMRGFAYYQLSDIFYTVPIVVSSSVPVESKLPPNTIDEIDAQIESDLAIASEKLTDKWSSNSDAGRPSSGSALGYLCRLYMRKAGRMRLNGESASAEWNKALGYANKIIAREGSIYSLQPEVWDIFDPSSSDAIYNNENIFAVHSSGEITSGSSDIGMCFTPWSYDMGWDLFSVPLELIWKFNKADQRYSLLFVTHFDDVYGGPKNYTIPESVDKVGTVYAIANGITTYELTCAYTSKYKYTKTGTYNYNTGNNMNLLRYADILLCKAEILNELNGPTGESVDLINRIRERAFQDNTHDLVLADYPTTEALRSAICDERLYEFNNEGTRRPDLIRMGLWKNRLDAYIAAIKLKSEYKSVNAGYASDYYSSMWKVYPGDLTEKDIRRYYPVPKRESDLNPDLLNCRSF